MQISPCAKFHCARISCRFLLGSFMYLLLLFDRGLRVGPPELQEVKKCSYVTARCEFLSSGVGETCVWNFG